MNRSAIIMPELSDFPSAEVQFDRDAKVVGSLDQVFALANGPCTDLIVMSHGGTTTRATPGTSTSNWRRRCVTC